MKQIVRNNTSFSKQLFELMREFSQQYVKSPSWAFLKYYQYLVKQYFAQNIVKGLLICLQMGMGKTLTAVAIAMDMLEQYDVIFLSVKSLHQNMRKDIRKYARLRSENDPLWKIGTLSDVDLDTWIDRKFSFVSLNASNMMSQLYDAAEGREATLWNKKFKSAVRVGNLDGKLLIIDEAHNFFRAVTNGSSNAIQLYELIMSSRVKLIFLTGTPIANDPFELTVAYNLLAGGNILPPDYKTFYKYFVSDGTIANRNIFQNRIMGLTSFVTHDTTLGADSGVKLPNVAGVEFPMEKPLVVVKLPMTTAQYSRYQLAREKEHEEQKRGGPNVDTGFIVSLKKPKNSKASSYRVKSRQLSNFAVSERFAGRNYSDIKAAEIPAAELTSPKLVEMRRIVEESPGIALVYSQFVGIGGIAAITTFLEAAGWTAAEVMAGSTVKVRLDGKSIIYETKELTDDEIEAIGNEPIANAVIEREVEPPYEVIAATVVTGAGKLRTMSKRRGGKRNTVEYLRERENSVPAPEIPVATPHEGSGRSKDISGTNSTPRKSHESEDIIISSRSTERGESFLAKDANGEEIANVEIEIDGDHYKLPKFDSHVPASVRLAIMRQMVNLVKTGPIKKIHVPSDVKGQRLQKFLENSGGVRQPGCNECFAWRGEKKGGGSGKQISPIDKLRKNAAEFQKSLGFPPMSGGAMYWANSLVDEKSGGELPGVASPPNVTLPPYMIVYGNEILDGAELARANLGTNGQISWIDVPEYMKNEYEAAMNKSVKRGGGKAGANKYIVISGEIPVEVRAAALAALNDPANKYGENIKLVIISATGAEGLDIKCCRRVVIFEPYWNYGRISQVISRAVRNDSHALLPETDRDVTPYILLSTRPVSLENEPFDEPTTDVELFEESMKGKKIIDEFNTALRETSIECAINAGKNCRKCNPTDKLLFNDDFSDMRDNCEEYHETKVSASEVEYGGKKYFYAKSNKTLGYSIFEYDELLGGYRELSENSPVYLAFADVTPL